VKIISGGQTGADRAALDFAIAHQIDHGGWCPRGRRAEDGRIPAKYHLQETAQESYAYRTACNVTGSDATVIFTLGPTLRGGTALTVRLATEHNRPLLHLDGRLSVAASAERLRSFLEAHDVNVLNVAGPRASQEPCIGALVHDVLTTALARDPRTPPAVRTTGVD
jgi:hypothetical protein